jgi:nitroreductase
MNFIDLILKRRSIRKYTLQKIEKEKIEILLRSAMHAPTAVNKQSWDFIVVEDKKIMKKVMDEHPNSRMLENASHAILVCGDENRQHDKDYWIADCGAATENILLAAKALDLGSCWIGIFPREARMKAISEIFNLPSHVQPFALISLGYPDEEKEIPDRYDPKKVFLNSWGNKY